MKQTELVVITKHQAKKQINHLGRALFVYVLFFGLLKYGIDFLETENATIVATFDLDYVRLLLTLVGLFGFVCIPFALASLFLKLNIKDYLKSARISIGQGVVFISIGITLYLLVLSASMLFSFFFQTDTLSYSFLGKYTAKDFIIKNILYFLTYVIVKPVVDEYAFRGIIQRQLGHYGRYFGVIASALLYTLAQTNLVDGIACFVIGWYLSLLTLHYHSLRPGIIVHIGVCGFLFALNSVSSRYLWILFIAIILMYILVTFFLFHNRKYRALIRYGATEWKLWKILLTSSSIILCILAFIVNVILSMAM